MLFIDNNEKTDTRVKFYCLFHEVNLEIFSLINAPLLENVNAPGAFIRRNTVYIINHVSGETLTTGRMNTLLFIEVYVCGSRVTLFLGFFVLSIGFWNCSYSVVLFLQRSIVPTV